MTDPTHQPMSIDILAFPGTTLILLASVIEPLRAANRITGAELYAWRILSMDGRPVETTAGIDIPAASAFRAEHETAPLFVVSSYNWNDHCTPAVKRALSRTARYRPFIAGIKSGVWLLAEASLLNNQKATIHWEDFEEFTSRYPDITALRERFVIDSKRMTTGGALPTLDLMLEIIRRRQGYSLALEVARSFIYERESGLRNLLQTSASTGQPGLDPRIVAAMRHMEESVDSPVTLARIARRIRTSERQMHSLFRRDLGVTPHVHYLALRLNAARRKVIETTASLSEIAEATGFNSSAAFSRSYRAQFHESAMETRRRLKGGG